MILDHNTTATVAYNLSGDNSDGLVTVNNQLTSDTANWVSSLNSKLITADEVTSIIGITDFDFSVSGVLYFETSTSSAPSPYPSIAEYGWLFDRSSNSCTGYGCLNNATGNENGYWTSTPVDSYGGAWNVYFVGRLNNHVVSNAIQYGVRPVITVNKSYVS